MLEIKKHHKEIPTCVTAFEHVFPGNKFENSKKGSPLEYLIFFATALMDFNYVNGIIIPDSDAGSLIHRIPFENMFERTEQAKKATSMGKGIGLYLSTQIIKAHEGKIWAESTGEGKGSIFYIELPILKVDRFKTQIPIESLTQENPPKTDYAD